MFLRIGFNPTRSTSPCYKPKHRYNTVIHNTKMNLSTVKWAQWDKTQSWELLVCSYVCASHCAQLLHTILHRTDLIVFPLTLQTITTAPMMSIWGKGGISLINQTSMIKHSWWQCTSLRQYNVIDVDHHGGWTQIFGHTASEQKSKVVQNCNFYPHHLHLVPC